MWNTWIPDSGDYPGTSYVSTEKGWMTGEIFLSWFKDVFLQNISQERPILLIYDKHSSHVTADLITC